MAEFVNFASGTITDSPLTIGATQVNSAAFATVLPVIAAPHVMSIVLDLAGAGGIPEIVDVTAHAASATQVTVVRGRQTSLGASAARSHAAGTTWGLAATATDLNRLAGDPGDLKAGIWSSPPDGWLLMGTSVAAADTTYPALWSVVPSSWKSGTTLNLPSMDGRAMLGGGTLGAVGGAMSHTLATTNLPAHTHDISHDHAATTSGEAGAHSHTIDHGHNGEFTSHANPGTGGFWFARRIADTGTTVSQIAPTTSGVVSGSVAAHTHAVDLPTFTGPSGSVGSGTAVDHTPSHLRVSVAIKT